MWRILLATLLALSTISVCGAVEAFGYGKLNSPFPGKCYIRGLFTMEVGQSMDSPYECARINCFHNQQATIQTCPYFDEIHDVPETCIDGGQLNEEGPYPDCCHRTYVCGGKVADI